MPSVALSDDVLHVALSRGEKLAGLLRDLRVPRGAVRSARVAADGFAELSGLRAPGLHLPGIRGTGTWRHRDRRPTYVALRRGVPALVLELSGQRYDRVLVSTPDAARLAEQLPAGAGSGSR